MEFLTRRDMLRHVIAASLTLAHPGSALGLSASERAEPLGARLGHFFAEGQSARTIGMRYLILVPEERDVRRLIGLVCRTPEGYRRLASTDGYEMRLWLGAQQRRDFAEGRTVLLDGWMLSRTEARLCALAALARPG